MEIRRSVIVGVGSCLPTKVLTNHDLSQMVDTSEDWIIERTGIKQRYIARDGETTVSLATSAAQRALENSKFSPDDVDLIVLATSTPDHTFPSSATEVQAGLGVTRGFAYDISAACSGFLYALAAADAQLKTGLAKVALVIGSEIFSRIIDWTDRNTCVLFGDGAGAVVLESLPSCSGNQERGILSASLRSDGRHLSKLYVDGGPSTTKSSGHVRMKGREVFKHAVLELPNIALSALNAAGVPAEDLDWFVPHQANKRIIDASVKKLGINPEKAIITVDIHGNTSAASIPLALDKSINDGRIREGDLVLLEAIGAGFTWGAILVRW